MAKEDYGRQGPHLSAALWGEGLAAGLWGAQSASSSPLILGQRQLQRATVPH